MNKVSQTVPGGAETIVVFGMGYVGLVQAAVWAGAGYRITGVDIDPQRIARLRRGEVDIREPDLHGLVAQGLAGARLQFFTPEQAHDVLSSADIAVIAVGTPAAADGAADLRAVEAVSRTIGRGCAPGLSVIIKSTVPVGTAKKVAAWVAQAWQKRGFDAGPGVVSCPEFLREGTAVADSLHPERIILGCDDAATAERVTPLLTCTAAAATSVPLYQMSNASAELTKYAANAFLATKLSYINEMAHLADRCGANIDHVARGIGSDPRIGMGMLGAGCGFGGACLPKDLTSLMHQWAVAGDGSALLAAVQAVNNRQRHWLQDTLAVVCAARGIQPRVVAVWGVTFKGDTNDVRDSPALDLLAALARDQVQVQLHDPGVAAEARAGVGSPHNQHWFEDKYAALAGADALLICTAWHEYQQADLPRMAAALGSAPLLDGRNLYPPEAAAAAGIDYISVGRPSLERRGG